MNFDFLKYRYYAYTFSLALLAAAVILYVKPGPKLGIDFAGGTLLHLKFSGPVPDEVIRGILTDPKGLHIENPIVQAAQSGAFTTAESGPRAAVGVSSEKLIRMDFLADKPGKGKHTYKEIDEALRVVLKAQGLKDEPDATPPNPLIKVLAESSVGPSVGQELRYQAVYAIILSLFGILAYITYQFEFKFAVPAIVALFHDVLCVSGFIMIRGFEFDMIQLAVLLTVVGYSINDTIVICDRIRENLKIMRRAKFYDIVNTSIGQTFTRTILTVFTSLLPLVTMRIFGGPVLSAFAESMSVGFVLGAFSSIFVVSPMIVWWKTMEERAI